ncbi:MAG TPA: protein-tyrosine-phosphatase [Crocinitomicaceae bacterium]|nr:low molecular weight phosphotyrosine protein phosphatase [Flavobacteriales bacterium]HBW86589.1 protein-tyrosine-phosphatase [Crocinitomicaceae bacterium]
MKILMVCLGNICRSPLAEGILNKKLEERSLSWVVDSCGTANYHIGKAPDKRMIQTAAMYNTDISQLKARQFSLADFEKFDLIFTMDKNNFEDVQRLELDNEQRQKVRLLLNEWKPGLDLEVPDPYYGTKMDFINVYELLDEALDSVINNWDAKK